MHARNIKVVRYIKNEIDLLYTHKYCSVQRGILDGGIPYGMRVDH